MHLVIIHISCGRAPVPDADSDRIRRNTDAFDQTAAVCLRLRNPVSLQLFADHTQQYCHTDGWVPAVSAAFSHAADDSAFFTRTGNMHPCAAASAGDLSGKPMCRWPAVTAG